MKEIETYYDLLKVDKSSNIAEIVAAYHSAKNAFSKDSLATYSLFTAEEIQIELSRLEEAYLTLSNIDKKREYDRTLSLKQTPLIKVTHSPNESPNATVADAPNEETVIPAIVADLSSYLPDDLNGAFLKQTRERKGLSVDDVSRITKIPTKFLRAIEEEDISRLPARVYVQGFIKNMAVLYKLDPKATATSYLNSIDSRTKEIWKE